MYVDYSYILTKDPLSPREKRLLCWHDCCFSLGKWFTKQYAFREDVMKKLLLSFMVLAVLGSCGKKNEVSTNGYGFSPITTSVQGAADLGAKIDNYQSQFGTGQLPYYGVTQTWGTLANTGLNLAYRYTKSTSTASGSGSNCTLKWGFILVCPFTSTTINMGNVAESRKVYNNSVDITAKGNELKAIINSANPLIPIQAQGTSYRVQTRDGKQYIIDTRYPLQAQPIGVADTSGTEYLYNITEN